MSHDPIRLEVLDSIESDGPVMIHADLMLARNFVGKATSRAAMLDNHLRVLDQAANSRPLWFACFNYDFCRAGQFDIKTSVCQVGPLAEYARGLPQYWRSSDPVFSICGTGHPVVAPLGSRRFAFDLSSAIGQVYARKGTILFYGAALHSATLLHFAESQSGGPVYRYDKTFKGQVTDERGSVHSVEYVYHVRPMGLSLDYDWPRLQSDLIAAGLLRQQRAGGGIVAQSCDARALVDHWVNQLRQDPLYLLDSATRHKVLAMNLPAGTRLQIEDFEPPQ
jgi:aminoglycoside N3'-acetyltransferase